MLTDFVNLVTFLSTLNKQLAINSSAIVLQYSKIWPFSLLHIGQAIAHLRGSTLTGANKDKQFTRGHCINTVPKFWHTRTTEQLCGRGKREREMVYKQESSQT